MYEQNGVKYYLMADPENDTIEIFKLTNNRFEEMHEAIFNLSNDCMIELDFNEAFEIEKRHGAAFLFRMLSAKNA